MKENIFLNKTPIVLNIFNFASLLEYEKNLKAIGELLRQVELKEKASYEEQLEVIEKMLTNKKTESIFKNFDFKDALGILAHRLRFFDDLKDEKNSLDISEIRNLFSQIEEEKENKEESKTEEEPKINEKLLKKLISVAKSKKQIFNEVFSMPYKEVLSLFENAVGFVTNDKNVENIRRALLLQSKIKWEEKALQTFCLQTLLNTYPTLEKKGNTLFLMPKNEEKYPVQPVERRIGEEKNPKSFPYDEIKERWGKEAQRSKDESWRQEESLLYGEIVELWRKDDEDEPYSELDKTKEFLEKFIKEVREISLVNEELVPFVGSGVGSFFACFSPMIFFLVLFGALGSLDGMAVMLSLVIGGVLGCILEGMYLNWLFNSSVSPTCYEWPSPSYQILAKNRPHRVLKFSAELQATREKIINMVSRVLSSMRANNRLLKVMFLKNSTTDKWMSDLKGREITLEKILGDLQHAKTYKMYKEVIRNLIDHIDNVIKEITNPYNDDAVLFMFFPYTLMNPSKMLEVHTPEVIQNDVILNVSEENEFDKSSKEEMLFDDEVEGAEVDQTKQPLLGNNKTNRSGYSLLNWLSGKTTRNNKTYRGMEPDESDDDNQLELLERGERAHDGEGQFEFN